jgi:hypothetical protein
MGEQGAPEPNVNCMLFGGKMIQIEQIILLMWSKLRTLIFNFIFPHFPAVISLLFLSCSYLSFPFTFPMFLRRLMFILRSSWIDLSTLNSMTTGAFVNLLLIYQNVRHRIPEFRNVSLVFLSFILLFISLFRLCLFIFPPCFQNPMTNLTIL